MKYEASHKFVRIGPRKARYVIDLIRGKSVNEAIYILNCVHKRAAYFVKKIVDSAVANAFQQEGMNPNELYIKEITADGGPILKRFRPGPMGRAMRIRKRTSHIVVKLAKKEEVQVPN